MHMDPVSDGLRPKFNLVYSQGARLYSQSVGGSVPDEPAAHLPGLLADPGWAPQPLLASCSVNTARLMGTRVPSDGTVLKMS